MIDERRRFPPELRTASVVPRWSVVWTLTRDTVANHSFFVTFYAREIARLIEWGGDIGDLMFRALTHDLDETVTGDIVSPVKQEIIDDKRAEAYVNIQMRKRLPRVMQDLEEIRARQHATLDGVGARWDERRWDEGTRIIKAADKLDALIFLIGEGRLGNGVIQPHLPFAWVKFERHWLELPVPMHAPRDYLQRLYDNVMAPVVKSHESNGGFGI